LLGDPQFPNSVLNWAHQNRISLFENFFETYSKLALTKPTDRSVAISGLESRFAKAFDTEGSYGIFERFPHRSILWQRSTVSRMKRIEYLSESKVPSWPWMACDGGISYTEITFAAVAWSDAVKCFFNKRVL
jgi:hypothetical protein